MALSQITVSISYRFFFSLSRVKIHNQFGGGPDFITRVNIFHVFCFLKRKGQRRFQSITVASSPVDIASAITEKDKSSRLESDLNCTSGLQPCSYFLRVYAAQAWGCASLCVPLALFFFLIPSSSSSSVSVLLFLLSVRPGEGR